MQINKFFSLKLAILTLLVSFFYIGNAFCLDVTPPGILEFDYYPSSNGGIGFCWKLNEPADYKIYYTDGHFVGWLCIGPMGIYKTEDSYGVSLHQRTIAHFYLQFIDQAGNITTTPTYEYSSYPYLRGYVSINNGALATNSLNVALDCKAFDPEFQVTQMSFSNDGKNWSAWEPYATTKNWQLAAGEGVKSVYVRFINSAGLYTTFPVIDSIYYTTRSQATGASITQVNGRRLLVKTPASTVFKPYKIKGVCWSPVSIGNPGENYIAQREAEFKKWSNQDIALMKEAGINTVRTYLDFGQDPTAFKAVLDELYNNGIMVIMAVDDCVMDLANLDRVVSNFKDHPAILMWQIGNEWNLNLYYWKFVNFEEAFRATEQAAQRIKQLDPFHPVTSVLGDFQHFTNPALGENWWNSVIEYYANKKCPSVDIWGFNIYRGGSFGGLFYEFSQISSKPMFIAEAGTDAYDQRIGNENPGMQSDFNALLYDEVYFHLSCDRPSEPCLGIAFFEWNDEWWKHGNSWAHDPGGYNMLYSHPDNWSDEEYFGMVDINRGKRQFYFTLGDKYKKQGQVVNLPSLLTLKAVSGTANNGVDFFRNNQRFYTKSGGAGGGRGFNFAVIDPKTGLVESVARFDTWFDKTALLYLKNYVNSFPSGKIIMAAIGDEGGIDISSPYREDAYKALESIGSKLIRNVTYWDSWAMISIKGQSGNLGEGLAIGKNEGGQPVEITANVSLSLDIDKDNIPDTLDTDRDNDGVTDAQELAQGTDPLDPDTDDDGVKDVLAGNVNHAPVLASIGNKSVSAGSKLEFIISATDSDGDALTYSAANLPVGATFNSATRTFSWTPTSSQAGTYQNVTFSVSDGKLTDYEAITITVNSVNGAPVLAAIGNQMTYESEPLTFTVSATDPNGDTLTYSASNLPAGASFNPSTRIFSWTPTYSQAGTYSNITFKVSDGRLTDSESITITVVDQDSPPTVVSLAPSSGSSYAGTTVAFTTTFSDIEGWKDIKDVYFIINSGLIGPNGFFGYYNQNTNKLYLRNDADTAWLGGYAPGSVYSISNSYVKLTCSGTTVSGSRNNMTIKWRVTFKSTFKGLKQMYLQLWDDHGCALPAVKKGTWTIK